jgi:hypothetical protein
MDRKSRAFSGGLHEGVYQAIRGRRAGGSISITFTSVSVGERLMSRHVRE